MARTVTMVLAVSLAAALFISCATATPQAARNQLAQSNIQYNDMEFLRRAEQGDTASVKLFLKAGMDPNTKNRCGTTALMVAACQGHADTVKALIEGGADLNMKNNDGTTAIICATAEGQKEIAELLEKAGAEPVKEIILERRCHYADGC